MPNQDWYDLGSEINDIVQKAIDARDFSRLNQTIGRTVNSAMEGVRRAGQAVEEAASNQKKRYTTQEQEIPFSHRWVNQNQNVPYYKKTTGDSALGYALTIVGSVGTGVFGFTIFVILLTLLIATEEERRAVFIASAVMLPLLVGCIIMLVFGCRTLGKVKRYHRYRRVLGERAYCEIKDLAREVKKPQSFVVKDLRRMIEKGLFLQGHIDRQQTCLIVTDEMYRQYQETERQMELRKQEAKAREEKAAKERKESGAFAPEVQKALEEGRKYIRRLRECNDAIPGEEVSEKISQIEILTAKIFQRLEQDPDIVSDLHKMMEYYLPTTIKLLEAYEELDGQPIQGENITSSKKEIEDTLDTINAAFENLLDSFFEEKAWDLAADISVLENMLAQEGLTKKDFGA